MHGQQVLPSTRKLTALLRLQGFSKEIINATMGVEMKL